MYIRATYNILQRTGRYIFYRLNYRLN